MKPGDPNLVVAGAVGSGPGMGRLIHYDHRTGQERMISVWPEAYGMGTAPAEHRYRFQWTFPIFYSRWDPRELWIAGNRVFRSIDEGQTWEVVSADLTRNDPTKLGLSGGPISRDNSGAEVYCTIFALAESLHERDVLWAGTDDGLVHLSRDRGRTWQLVTPPELPGVGARQRAGAVAPRRRHVLRGGHTLQARRPTPVSVQDDGLRPHAGRASAEGIPDGEITRVIREDPSRRGLLYAGTETGCGCLFDAGGAWQPLRSNLPVAPIHDLIVKDTDMVVATHGRSFWILDDLTPLHQMADQIAGADGASLRAPSDRALARVPRARG